MLLEDFVKEFNGAPVMLHEFAVAALDVRDCPELHRAAQAFLEAYEQLDHILSSIGVEVG